MAKLLELPFFRQHTDYTCGPASLKMIFEFFGLKFKERKIARMAKTTKSGTNHLNLINTARRNGFYCYVHENSTISHIKHFIERSLPVIVNYLEPTSNEGHYAVIVGYKKNKLILNDPWDGRKFILLHKEFIRRWHDSHSGHSYYGWLLVLAREKFDVGRQYSPII